MDQPPQSTPAGRNYCWVVLVVALLFIAWICYLYFRGDMEWGDLVVRLSLVAATFVSMEVFPRIFSGTTGNGAKSSPNAALVMRGVAILFLCAAQFVAIWKTKNTEQRRLLNFSAGIATSNNVLREEKEMEYLERLTAFIDEVDERCWLPGRFAFASDRKVVSQFWMEHDSLVQTCIEKLQRALQPFEYTGDDVERPNMIGLLRLRLATAEYHRLYRFEPQPKDFAKKALEVFFLANRGQNEMGEVPRDVELRLLRKQIVLTACIKTFIPNNDLGRVEDKYEKIERLEFPGQSRRLKKQVDDYVALLVSQ